MYVGDGIGDRCTLRPRGRGFFRTNDATAASPVFTDLTTTQNIGYCTAQCWYDNVVYSPPGKPDVVYLGGSLLYGRMGLTTNGRAFIRSANAGVVHRHDVGCATSPDRCQPNVAIAPGLARDRRDPGHGRRDLRHRTAGSCARAACLRTSRRNARARGLTAPQPCALPADALRGADVPVQPEQEALDAAVPEPVRRRGQPQAPPGRDAGQRHVRDDRLGRHLAADHLRRRRPVGLQRGQQRREVQLVHVGQFHDANFQNGDPTKWVIASGPIVVEPGRLELLRSDHRRSEPGQRGTIFEGSQSVWRTQDWGGQPGVPRGQLPRVHDLRCEPGLRRLRPDRAGGTIAT